jgi:hypothetical protein
MEGIELQVKFNPVPGPQLVGLLVTVGVGVMEKVLVGVDVIQVPVGVPVKV